MSSLQCLKRVHLELNRPELAKFSKATQAAFGIGHAVGEVAVDIYGGNGGTMVEYSGGSFTKPLSETDELMRSMFRTPIFEATLRYEDVLVREDVLIPVGNSDWRVVEVKASTRLKPEHIHDCAIQAWVHTGAGHTLNGISLAHVDNQFEYAGDGDYNGLLVEHDLSQEVFDLLPEVPRWVERARRAVEGPTPDISVGMHCAAPYECPFVDHCWPGDSPYPVQGLGGNKERLGRWISAGFLDIRDVPAEEISSEQQLRIRRITRQGTPELLPDGRSFAAELAYPRYYLDFETVAPAIPVWPGTRPYQTIPFQWSCHIETAPGETGHREFLDLSGDPPMRSFAETLIDVLGDEGPVLMYTSYERRIIRDLISLFPDLEPALQSIDQRLVDLHPVTRANYYHPDMLGSWSIKSVLPTIAPEMDYQQLEGIHEGTEAAQSYFEAISTETSSERKAEIRAQLLAYCKHDTKAMVRLLHFLENS
jgi:hypothetical protein